VLGYVEAPEGWLIVGSKGGAPRDPAWVHNLAAHPDATVVLADGEREPVRAEPLSGKALQEAWQRIDSEAPEYAAYRSKTERDIPVIRLERGRGSRPES
jgi:deazaflavin-dependent oxidoreductase (nitroreductase family)